MTNHNKLEKVKLKSQAQDKKSLIVGSIIATLLAATPYFFYLYEGVPDEKIWDTFFGTYRSKYYESAAIAAWTMMGKIIPLYLLFIWFFTCRHWWYHVLLIPIAMYLYQLTVVINDDGDFVDEFQLYFLIPIMAIVIPSIYLIRAKMFNRITSQSMQDLEDEYRVGPRSVWDKVKDYF